MSKHETSRPDCPSDETLADFAAGELHAAERAQCTAHFKSCSRCRELIKNWEQLNRELIPRQQEDSSAFIASVMGRVRREVMLPPEAPSFFKRWYPQMAGIALGIGLLLLRPPSTTNQYANTSNQVRSTSDYLNPSFDDMFNQEYLP